MGLLNPSPHRTQRTQRNNEARYPSAMRCLVPPVFALFFRFVSNAATMRIVKTLSLCLVLASTCLAATPSSDNFDADRLIRVALQPSPLEANLRHLTDEIGGRIP